MANQVMEDQLAFAPRVAGVDDALDVLTRVEFLDELELRFMLRDGFQIECCPIAQVRATEGFSVITRVFPAPSGRRAAFFLGSAEVRGDMVNSLKFWILLSPHHGIYPLLM